MATGPECGGTGACTLVAELAKHLAPLLPVQASGADAGYQSSGSWSAQGHVPHEALRRRLDRHRAGNDDGWVEVLDRRKGQARYLYAAAVALPLIQELQGAG